MRYSIVPLHSEINGQLRAIPPLFFYLNEKVLIGQGAPEIVKYEAIYKAILLIVNRFVLDIKLLLCLVEGLNNY